MWRVASDVAEAAVGMTVASMIVWALAFWFLFDGDPIFTLAGALFGYAIANP